MFREVILLNSNELVITIPPEYLNKYLEIFVIPVENENQKSNFNKREQIEECLDPN
ncbi:MAG: hypothetical protein HW421_113 [Ignavibacteria bacterium]|nr:hypothetical protein [Ignavibacteria bacterium]